VKYEAEKTSPVNDLIRLFEAKASPVCGDDTKNVGGSTVVHDDVAELPELKENPGSTTSSVS
jgi:myo-inositol-1-phosphate synthase